MHSKISGTKCCENISNMQWKTALEITVAKPLAKSVSIFFQRALERALELFVGNSPVKTSMYFRRRNKFIFQRNSNFHWHLLGENPYINI